MDKKTFNNSKLAANFITDDSPSLKDIISALSDPMVLTFLPTRKLLRLHVMLWCE
jgi:hypothetical protein